MIGIYILYSVKSRRSLGFPSIDVFGLNRLVGEFYGRQLSCADEVQPAIRCKAYVEGKKNKKFSIHNLVSKGLVFFLPFLRILFFVK